MEKYNVLLDKPSVTWVTTKGIEPRIDSEYYSSFYLKKQLNEEQNQLEYRELGTLGEGFSYGTPPYGHLVEQGIPYLRIPNIEGELFLSENDLAFVDEEYHKKNIRNEVDEGDILFRIKGQLGQAVVVPRRYKGAHTGSSFLRFTPKNLDAHYLVLYLSSTYGKNQILRKQSNSIIKYLNIEDIKSIKVPIPSPHIQKYIGDKVRKAEKLREEAKRLKIDSEELFQKTIGLDINFDNKKNRKQVWVQNKNINENNISGDYYKEVYLDLEKSLDKSGTKLLNLKNVSKGIVLGNTNKISDYYHNTGIPYVTTKNIKEEGVDFSTLLFIPESIHNGKLKKSQAYPNDILYNKSGNVGLSAILTDEYKEYNVVSDIIIIRPDVEKINPHYLVLYLNSKIGKSFSERMAGGAVFQHISIYEVAKLKVPILSSDIQEQIGDKKAKAELYLRNSNRLIEEARQEVETLIEGNFDMSKLDVITTESR